MFPVSALSRTRSTIFASIVLALDEDLLEQLRVGAAGCEPPDEVVFGHVSKPPVQRPPAADQREPEANAPIRITP